MAYDIQHYITDAKRKGKTYTENTQRHLIQKDFQVVGGRFDFLFLDEDDDKMMNIHSVGVWLRVGVVVCYPRDERPNLILTESRTTEGL